MRFVRAKAKEQRANDNKLSKCKARAVCEYPMPYKPRLSTVIARRLIFRAWLEGNVDIPVDQPENEEEEEVSPESEGEDAFE